MRPTAEATARHMDTATPSTVRDGGSEVILLRNHVLDMEDASQADASDRHYRHYATYSPLHTMVHKE
jgi:hypothetical protein